MLVITSAVLTRQYSFHALSLVTPQLAVVRLVTWHLSMLFHLLKRPSWWFSTYLLGNAEPAIDMKQNPDMNGT